MRHPFGIHPPQRSVAGRKKGLQLRISVIIAAKDEEGYIRKTLDSIAFQDYAAEELIVVDNGSRDNTAQIAREHKAKVFRNGKNIASARNSGATTAGGDVLVFVDADTELPRDCLSRVAGIFSGDPGVAGLCVEVAPKDTQSDNTFCNRLLVEIFYNMVTKLSVKLGRPRVTGAFMAFRQDVFLRIGGFREDLALGEDTDIYRRLARYWKIRHSPEIRVCTSMRRFRVRPVYWLCVWSLNALSYELFGRALNKRYPRAGQ